MTNAWSMQGTRHEREKFCNDNNLRVLPFDWSAKITDTRAKKYIAEHGQYSWELDALKPEVIDSLIADAIEINLDRKRFSLAQKRQESEQQALQAVILANDAVE